MKKCKALKINIEPFFIHLKKHCLTIQKRNENEILNKTEFLNKVILEMYKDKDKEIKFLLDILTLEYVENKILEEYDNIEKKFKI